jgi:TonB-dependent receptor
MAAASALSLGLAMATVHTAQAADAPAAAAPEDSAVVVVHGFRASLQSALAAKKASDLPMESVAPEDIGKMPDVNVAESLQRLPGIQIDRNEGHGTSVLIDGLRQNLTTLNGSVFLTGKEFYVSGEAANGGNGANALYSSLEGVPSEEVGRIDVYKSPNASLTEGGLGGIVDLRLRNPLDQPKGLTVGGNIRMSSAQGAEHKSTPDGTLVVSYKPDSSFAVTGSLSYDDEDTHTKEYEAYNRSSWVFGKSATSPYVGPLTPAAQTTISTNYIIPQYAYFSDIFDTRKTTRASLGFAWKLSDSVKTSVNWFYSKEDETTLNYTDKVGFNGSGANSPGPIPGIDPTKPFSIDGNGVLGSGTLNLTGAETQTLYQGSQTSANNFQWHTAWDNGGPLTGTLDMSYARATSDLQGAAADVEHGFYNARTSTGGSVATSPAAPGCDNFAASCTAGNHGYEITWTNGGTTGLPTATALAPYTDINTNPLYTTFKSHWAWANMTKQTLSAVKGDLFYKPGFLSSADGVISGGFRLAERDVDQTFGRYLLNGGSSVNNCCSDPNGGTYLYYLDPGYVSIPYATAVSQPSLVKTVNNFAVGNIVVRDPTDMMNPATYLNSVWNHGTGATPNNTEKFFVDTLSSFTIKEKTSSVYLMADLGGKDANYHANFGVRIVDTDLTVNGAQTAPVPTFYGSASWNGVNSNNTPVTTKRSYIDVLPSFNFSLDLTDEQIIRISAARVVSPVDLFPLGLGNSYGFTRETGGRTNVHTGVKDGFKFNGGQSGNAQLDPYRANQVYASWENYFAPGGLVSVGTFYKQVDNFVVYQNIPTLVVDDFGGTTATVTKPVNAGHGSIYGLELGAQFPFSNGFGVAANYTLSQSYSTQTTAFTNAAQIPGVSKNAVTATVYYEKGGFGARLSYSWRDKAVNDGIGGSTFAFADPTGTQKTYGVFLAPYGQVDGQISYDLTPHIGIVLSGQNMTNAKQHTYLQYPNQAFTYDDSGTRYFLGLKFKY